MLAELTHENISIFRPGPMPFAARRIRRLIRFLRRWLLELTVGGLVIAWWLQVFATWVGFFRELSMLGGPS